MAVTAVVREPPHQPTSSAAQFQDVHKVITECLQHSHFADALTISELYYETCKSDDALIYISECLSHLGRIEELYTFLSALPSLSNPRLRYTYARCCFTLNKTDESLRALLADTSRLGVIEDSSNPLASVQLHPVLDGSPSASFAQVLLSKILCETGSEERSRLMAANGVRSNAFLWSAVTQYLQMGGEGAARLFTHQEDVSANATSENVDTTTKSKKIEDVAKEQAMEQDKNEDEEEEGETNVTPARQPAYRGVRPAAPRKTRTSEIIEMRRSSRTSAVNYGPDSENAGARTSRVQKNFSKTLQLRSTRANQQPLSSRNSNALRSLSSSSQSLSGAAGSKKKEIEAEKAEREKEKREKEEREAFKKGSQIQHSSLYRDLRLAFQGLAEVEEQIARYNWKTAIELLKKLPAALQKHPLCRLQKAKITFESCDYAFAREILNDLRVAFPYRMDGMDLLSTSLWHMQRNYELSALAQELTQRARNRPESWCVAGNCFSLQKQHQKAVECLQRAIKLDSHYGYAYSLLGHELIETDELEQASQAFRKSLACNPNDYRAWYGLGMVNHRKEQHALAQRDLTRALTLNKNNVSLLCQLAVVEKALGKNNEAVRLLQYALSLDPSRMVSRFHLAKLQYEMGDFDSCITHLEELKVTSPDEAQIFFLLGKAHRRRGNTHLALLNFNWAAEMDPRGEQTMHYLNEQPFDDDGSP